MEDVLSEEFLVLREVSSGMTVMPNPNTHEIAKLSYEFDIERDRSNLVAVPLPNTPSMAETWISEFRKENNELKTQLKEIKSENKEIKNENANMMNILETLLNENDKLKALMTERSRNKYYFGTLKVIRIWFQMVYEKVRGRRKVQFNNAFNGFIYGNSKKIDEKNVVRDIQKVLDMPADDIKVIRELVISRNFYAHGEEEFLACLSPNNISIIRKQFEMMKESVEEAKVYEDRNSRVIELTYIFLTNIGKELLKRKLLTE